MYFLLQYSDRTWSPRLATSSHVFLSSDQKINRVAIVEGVHVPARALLLSDPLHRSPCISLARPEIWPAKKTPWSPYSIAASRNDATFSIDPSIGTTTRATSPGNLHPTPSDTRPSSPSEASTSCTACWRNFSTEPASDSFPGSFGDHSSKSQRFRAIGSAGASLGSRVSNLVRAGDDKAHTAS